MKVDKNYIKLDLDRIFPDLKIKRSLNPDKKRVIALFKKKHLSHFTKILPFNKYSEPVYYQIHIRSSEGLLFCFTYYLQSLFGGDEYTAFLSAAAIEILSAAKIILDDIFDKDEIRSGCPSVWKKYSLRKIFLSIDYIKQKVIEKVSKEDLEIGRIIEKAWFKGLESFCLEEELYKKKHASLNDWLKIIPSFAPFGFAGVEVIKRNSKLSKSSLSDLEEYNKNLTIAWVFDDPLDIFYLERSKKFFSDIRNGYINLPIILLLKKMNENDKEIFWSNFGKVGKEEHVIRLLEKYNIKNHCFRIVKKYHDKAMYYLRCFWQENYNDILRPIFRAYSYLRATGLKCDFI